LQILRFDNTFVTKHGLDIKELQYLELVLTIHN